MFHEVKYIQVLKMNELRTSTVYRKLNLLVRV